MSSSDSSDSDNAFAPSKPVGYARSAAERKKQAQRQPPPEAERRPVKKVKKDSGWRAKRYGFGDEMGEPDIMGEEEEEGEIKSHKRKRSSGVKKKAKEEARVNPLRILARDLSDDDFETDNVSGSTSISSTKIQDPHTDDTTDDSDEDLNECKLKISKITIETEEPTDSEDGDLSVHKVIRVRVATKIPKAAPTPPIKNLTNLASTPSKIPPPRPPPAASPARLRRLNARPQLPTTDEQEATPPFVLGRDARGEVVVPQSINVHLRDYQREGVRFLFDKWKRGEGGILGDDMGLGKTIQALAFLSAIMRLTGTQADRGRRGRWSDEMKAAGRMVDGLGRRNAKPSEKWPTCLIIAPASVCHNWKRELETWTYASVGMYTKGENKPDLLHQWNRGLFDIIIVGYESCLRSISDLERLDFSVILADEVHRIKDPARLTTQALHQFKCKVRLGMTGTAIQNRDSELWCILDWCSSGTFGTLDPEWLEYITFPLRYAQAHDATAEELVVGRLRAQQLVNFVLPPWFLRRTKKLISHQLPTKTDYVVLCEQTNEQKRVISTLRMTENVQLLIRKDELCGCGSGEIRGGCHFVCNADGVPWKHLILKYCTIFRKIANHLALVLPSDEDTSEQREVAKELTAACFSTWNPLHLKLSVATLFRGEELCGKWKMLKLLLEKWKREDVDNKVLIFSMSTQLLKLIKAYLDFTGYNYRSLTGADPINHRMSIIDEFQSDPSIFIFLVSTMAGGVGLNLTAANKVVIFDPSWNPASDLQAMDRAFRIGQKRNVEVYRLVTAGSIEEIIHERQLYKRASAAVEYEGTMQRRLFDGVMDKSDRRGELFGLKNLFSQREDGLATAEINERIFKVELQLGRTSSAPTLEAEDEDDDHPPAPAPTVESDVAGFLGLSNPSEGPLPADPEILEIFAKAGATYFHEGSAPLGETEAEREIFKQAKLVRKMNAAKAKGIKANDLLGDWQRGHGTNRGKSTLRPNEFGEMAVVPL